MPLSVSFQGQSWKKQQSTAAVCGPESASTVPPPPASWENRGARPPPGGGGGDSPVLGSGGGRGRGRSRLAFFPANDDGGSSRSPSPAGPVAAGLGGSRGYGFLSNSPPPVGGVGVGERDSRRWWSGSESTSPRQRQQQQQQQQQRQRQRSLSPPRVRGRGLGMPEEDEDGVVLHVACLPVTGGDGGQAMMGVLKVQLRCGGEGASCFSSSVGFVVVVTSGPAGLLRCCHRLVGVAMSLCSEDACRCVPRRRCRDGARRHLQTEVATQEKNSTFTPKHLPSLGRLYLSTLTLSSLYLQAWRQQHLRQRRGDESNRAPDNGFAFAGGEMAALGVLAGQAAAALRRLGAEAAEKEGVMQELDAAAADRASEIQVRNKDRYTAVVWCWPTEGARESDWGGLSVPQSVQVGVQTRRWPMTACCRIPRETSTALGIVFQWRVGGAACH